MMTWVVEKEQVDREFSLQELQKFSKEKPAKVVIKGVMVLENGVVSWLA